MIEPLLSVLVEVMDRLIALVRERGRSRKELFYNHVQDIFEMLEDVVGDYLEIFSEIERDFSDPCVPPSQVLDKIIERRRVNAPLRKKLYHYLSAVHDGFKLRDNNLERFVLCCAAMLRREPSFYDQGPVGRTSTLTGMVTQITDAVSDYHGVTPISVWKDRIGGGPEARAMIDATPRKVFSLVVRATKKDVECAWNGATSAYYRLKVTSLS